MLIAISCLKMINQDIVDLIKTFLQGTKLECDGSVQPVVQQRVSYTKTDVASLWDEYFGNEMEVICPMCSKNRMFKDDRTTWEMGHIQSHADGGSGDLSNIRPVCFKCNRNMGKENMITYLIRRYPERYHITTKILKLYDSK